MSQVQQNSFEKRTSQAKVNAAISSLAMLIAKENKDPLYAKANGFKRKFMQLKMQTIHKYLAQAKSRYFSSNSNK